MLSHVSGSSNRQALARIPALEQQTDRLETALRQSRARGHAALEDRDRRIRCLEHELIGQRVSLAEALRAATEHAPDSRFERTLSQERHRTELLEVRLAEQAQRLDEQSLEIQALKELLAEGRDDLERAEYSLKALLGRLSGEATSGTAGSSAGRPCRSNPAVAPASRHDPLRCPPA